MNKPVFYPIAAAFQQAAHTLNQFSQTLIADRRRRLPGYGPVLFLALLLLGLLPGAGAGQSCSGEVLNISQATHSQSGASGSWTVPTGGPYKVKITAKGAKGGSGTSSTGGNGATMIGEFILNAGQTLQAMAGSPGGNSAGTIAAGGGGGGSGVQIQSSHLLTDVTHG